MTPSSNRWCARRRRSGAAGDRRALPDVDGAGRAIDRFDLAEGRTVTVGRSSPRADLALLRREPVPVDDAPLTVPTRPTNSSPASPAFSSSSSSGGRAQRRKYSHQAAFFSRRCQSSRLASSQCACSLSFRSAGSSGTSPASRSYSAWMRCWCSSTSSLGRRPPGGGRATSCPPATSSARRSSSQSRRCSRRDAVVAIVGADRRRGRRPVIDVSVCRVRAACSTARSAGVASQSGIARSNAVERLQLLERVAFDTCTQRLAHHGIEVDEALAP